MTDAQKLREWLDSHWDRTLIPTVPDDERRRRYWTDARLLGVCRILLSALEKYGDYDALVDHMGIQPDFVGPDELCGLAQAALAKAVEELK